MHACPHDDSDTICTGMAQYREIFCRQAGFDHVSRYVTGLLLSPHKTLQGTYDRQVWGAGSRPSRRAMHAAVFEAGWKAEVLTPRAHRAVIAREHRGRGRGGAQPGLDLCPARSGPQNLGMKRAWDHVEQRLAQYQTVVTAVMANRDLIDGVEVIVQQPDRYEEEVAYLKETVRESYEQMATARGRLLELCHHLLHRLGYKKRTEIALEIAHQLEQEGPSPLAHYAFDNGVLTLELTRFIETVGKHWVSELESSRHIQWYGQWHRVAVHRGCGSVNRGRYLVLGIAATIQ